MITYSEPWNTFHGSLTVLFSPSGEKVPQFLVVSKALRLFAAKYQCRPDRSHTRRGLGQTGVVNSSSGAVIPKTCTLWQSRPSGDEPNF